MSAEAWFFWSSVVWLGYVWIGYPLVLEALSLTRRIGFITADDYYPTVSVLIAARNERQDIGWKLAQTLAWDYPADRLEVLVGSDASTDGTDEAIRSVRDSRLRFVRNRERAGKNLTLNRLAGLAHGDLLFFTDANTHIGPQCLKTMVRHFADPRVGCVTGMECNLTGPETSTITTGSNAYLEYESAVDTLESKLGSVLVCDGSIYCLRSALFTDLDPDLANDLEHPVRVGGAGAAILYEPGHVPSSAALARPWKSLPAGEESLRKVRSECGGCGIELRGLRLWQFAVSQILAMAHSASPRYCAGNKFPFATRALVCCIVRSADRILRHGTHGCVATRHLPREWLAAATFRFPSGPYRRISRCPRRLPSEDVCNVEHC